MTISLPPEGTSLAELHDQLGEVLHAVPAMGRARVMLGSVPWSGELTDETPGLVTLLPGDPHA